VRVLFVLSGVPNYFESTRPSFTYKRIPVYDASTSDLLSRADEIVSFISTALYHGSVLVHCQRGVSRSVTCVAFYLMRKVGMPLDAALALCRRRRPGADPIPAFLAQLRKYEERCRELGVIKEPASTTFGGGFVRGPLTGPVRGSGSVIGPAMGPVREKSTPIGPVMGPSAGPSRKRPIGPSLPPLSKREKTSDGGAAPNVAPGVTVTSLPPSDGGGDKSVGGDGTKYSVNCHSEGSRLNDDNESCIKILKTL